MPPSPPSACWPTAASAQAPAALPSLRLVAADESLKITTREALCCPNIGLWVAATGGDFRIDLKRPGYGEWQAAQVDTTTGATLRPIPRRSIAATRGLKDFISIRFLDTGGDTVGRRSLTFCPGESQGAERLDDGGPRVPRFQGSCERGFPFTLGMVWGVTRGWAIPAVLQGSEFTEFTDIPRRLLAQLPARNLRRLRALARRAPRPIRLEPGRYRVVARISPTYRRLFEIPAADAHVTLRVRVVRAKARREGGGGGGAGGDLVGPMARHSAAAPDSGPLAAQTVPKPAAATLPDLAALQPWDLGVRHRKRGDRDILNFASSPWNAGPAPLVVEGFRRARGRVMDAYQYFFDAGGEVVGRARAGAMAFHEAPRHDHWHFLQLVTYRVLLPNGRTVVRNRKQSFCITPTDAVDLTLPRALLTSELAALSLSSCGAPQSIWIRETLPAGWADTYVASVPGQSFDITGVPNGRYLVEMRVNPRGELFEVSTDNNVARRRIVLSGKPGKRRGRMAAWRGIRQ